MAAGNLAQLQQHSEAAAPRVIHRYTIPKTCTDGKVASFGIVEWTLDEELMAGERRKGMTNQDARGLENAKAVLVEVNGKRVSLDDGSADTWIRAMTPKTRELLITAFVRHNVPTQEETESFFKSATASV